MGTLILNFLSTRLLANKYAKFFELIKKNDDLQISNELTCLKNEKMELINFQNEQGVTLLMFAVYIGNVKIINSLLDNGANAKIKDKEGKNTLFYLANNKGSNKQEILKILLKENCDVNDTDHNSATCLIEAAKLNDTELVKVLLDEEAEVEIFDMQGVGALHRAIDNCNIDMVKLILSKKCTINHTDKNGISALHIAAMHNDIELLKLLINRGGNLNAKDNKMNTPLTFARHFNSKEAFYYLKKFGGKEFKQRK